LRGSRCDASGRRRRALRSLGPRAPRATQVSLRSRRRSKAHPFVLNTPAARLIALGEERLLLLEEVEALLASRTLVVDACRHVVRDARTVVSLARRPVLFALARALGEAWPGDVPRGTLLARAFGAKRVDESHRARLQRLTLHLGVRCRVSEMTGVVRRDVELMSIGQVAKATGVATTALRYYEREGVLTPTLRSRAGYRLYSRRALEQLEFIRAAQAVGFTFDDVHMHRFYTLGSALKDSRPSRRPKSPYRGEDTKVLKLSGSLD
jgi:hypothetical protein